MHKTRRYSEIFILYFKKGKVMELYIAKVDDGDDGDDDCERNYLEFGDEET